MLGPFPPCRSANCPPRFGFTLGGFFMFNAMVARIALQHYNARTRNGGTNLSGQVAHTRSPRVSQAVQKQSVAHAQRTSAATGCLQMPAQRLRCGTQARANGPKVSGGSPRQTAQGRHGSVLQHRQPSMRLLVLSLGTHPINRKPRI